MKQQQHLLSRYRNPLRLSFNTAALRQSELVHGVCAETSTPTTLKKMLGFVFCPALARCRVGFHTHQTRAFVSRCWAFTVPVKAEEDLQYKSAYKHWDVGCVWLSHWMGGCMLNLLQLFYIRLQALVQTEHLSIPAWHILTGNWGKLSLFFC